MTGCLACHDAKLTPVSVGEPCGHSDFERIWGIPVKITYPPNRKKK